MVVLGGGAVSYERGTPIAIFRPEHWNYQVCGDMGTEKTADAVNAANQSFVSKNKTEASRAAGVFSYERSPPVLFLWQWAWRRCPDPAPWMQRRTPPPSGRQTPVAEASLKWRGGQICPQKGPGQVLGAYGTGVPRS